jgi:hypothetical protein
MTFAVYSPILSPVADWAALPAAWVVKCKKCGCTVTCRAIDSQLEHAFGVDRGSQPEFGFRPWVPLISGAIERTEVDMRLGTVLFEAKLSESDVQTQRANLVEGYRDFKVPPAPNGREKYISYQLIRNVLSAHALGRILRAH